MNARRGQGKSETQALASWSVAPTPPVPPPTFPKLLSAKIPQAAVSSLPRIWFPYEYHHLFASWVCENFRILV